MRFKIAVLVSRLLFFIGRLVHKGTAKPGDIARKICPNILGRLTFDGKIICVTGTNGKTTTSNMITHILRENGFTVINNSYGSNMLDGITTSFLNECDMSGRVKADFSVIEVDERWLRFLVKEIHPDCLLVTNLLRDQIVRNCCPEIVLEKIKLGITDGTVLVLNAQDPVSQQASWGRDNPVVWFSVDRTERSTDICVSGTNDAKVCPKCLHSLSYDYYHYNHIGNFRCENCGFETPNSDFRGTDVDFEHMTMKINGHTANLKFNATYYMINAVSAVAVCQTMTGLPAEKIIHGAETFDIGVTKRYEETEFEGRKVQFILTKQNPASIDQSVNYVAEKPGIRTAVIISGNVFHTQRRDVIFLYDVAYENLRDVEYIVIVGARRYDMAVRLKLAGIDMSRIYICEDENKITETLRNTKGDIYVMSPLHSQTKKNFLR